MNQFISFPKSGRTWIRYCLLQYGITDKDIKFHHDGFEYSSKKDPVLDFSTDKRIEQYKDIPTVFMKRNFLDTYLSFYHQIVFRYKDVFNLELTLEELSAHPYFGYRNLLSFHNMQSQVIKSLNNQIIVDYDDCQNDMLGTVKEILQFYKINYNEEKLLEAVNKSTFNEMRKIEKEKTFSDDWLLPRNNIYKTRKGVVGSFYEESNEIARHYCNDTLLNHEVVEQYQFICLLNGLANEKASLAKEVDFIYKRYGKKVQILDNIFIDKYYPYLDFDEKNKDQQNSIMNEIIKEWFDKGYNIIMNLNSDIIINDKFKKSFLNINIKSHKLDINTDKNQQYDIEIDRNKLTLEKSLSKLLSEIYYNLLYK